MPSLQSIGWDKSKNSSQNRSKSLKRNTSLMSKTKWDHSKTISLEKTSTIQHEDYKTESIDGSVYDIVNESKNINGRNLDRKQNHSGSVDMSNINFEKIQSQVNVSLMSP